MKHTLLLSSVLCLLLASCDGNKQIQDENQQLKKENELLTQQLDQCQNNPVHLLEGAQGSLKRKDYPTALATLQDLVRRHPDSEEAKEARKLLVAAKAGAKRATAIEEAKADKLAVLNEKKAGERKRIEAKFRAVIDGCMGYSQTTRRGGSEYVFNSNLFKERMLRQGFKQQGGDYSNNYDGRYKGHSVSIKYGGATASSNGWVQHWDVDVE
jgi:hypothetical protein